MLRSNVQFESSNVSENLINGLSQSKNSEPFVMVDIVESHSIIYCRAQPRYDVGFTFGSSGMHECNRCNSTDVVVS